MAAAASCTKTPFASERAAKRARRAKRISDKLRVYRCPLCARWHLSNSHNSGGTRRPRLGG